MLAGASTPRAAQQRVEGPLPWLLVGLLALALAWHSRALDYRGDDAAITFRYVRNLLDGRGLVYNVGERVEGYSNFSWVLLLAVTTFATGDVQLSARVLGAALGAACVVLTYGVARRLATSPGRALLGPLLLTCATPFALWSGSGLEVPLFAALLLAALRERLAEQPPHALAGVWLGLLALTRPEGLLFFLVSAAQDAVQGRWQALRRTSVPVALLVVPHLLFRRAYYGQWLPNTFYAKVDRGWPVVERGARYLASYAELSTSLFAVCVLLGLLGSLRRPAWRGVAWSTLAYLTWVVGVGGDGLFLARFVAHVLPLLCLLAAAVPSAADWDWPDAGRWMKRFRVPLVALLVGSQLWPSCLLILAPGWPWMRDASGLQFPDPQGRWLMFDQYFAERVARAGRYLDVHAHRDELVAANPAGIGFYMRQPVLDMLGLNDATIAQTRQPGAGRGRAGHERSNAAYLLSRRPAYVLLANVAVLPQPLDDAGVASRLYAASERTLWERPDFHRDYERVVVELEPSGPFRYFTFYRRRAGRAETR